MGYSLRLHLCQISALLAALLIFLALPACALAETRSLKIYYIHTREKAEVVYKKDGRYVDSGLKKLNYLLRDWRRNEPTNMDPRLFDLIWQVYRVSGSRDYIHVVSAYRSPATNNMLRSKSASSGVAKNSQHTLGKAMDFYLPDVNLAKLRQIGLKQEGGGVGYYPTSGSPFIHLDVGSVRHWPRMNRKELMALFPDGKTIHVPSDGKPLDGYNQALAAYNARKGALPNVMVAGNAGRSKTEKAKPEKTSLMASLFGKKQKKENETVKQQKANSQTKSLFAERTSPIENPIVNQDTRQNLSPPDSEATVVVLPESDIPIPAISPFKQAQESEPDEPDEISEFLIADASGAGDKAELNALPEKAPDINMVPIPVLKKRSTLVKPLPATSTQMAYAPNLTPRTAPYLPPQNNQKPNVKTIETVAASTPTKAADEAKAANEALDEVENLIAWADKTVPLPKEDNDLATDASFDKQARLTTLKEDMPSDNFPEIDKETIRAIIVQTLALEEEDELAADQQMVASITPQTAPKTNKPRLDELAELIARSETPSLTEISLAGEKISHIPEIVFVSGLKKGEKYPPVATLSGRAINFPPVARIGAAN